MKNKNTLIVIIIIVLALIATLFLFSNSRKENVSENNTSSAETINYITFFCPSGEDIKINYADNANEATVLFQDEEHNLQRARSASGSRYENEDESIVFWEHQDEAMLIINGATVAENCKFEQIPDNAEDNETDKDNSEKISIAIDKTTSIQLETNPTTGYSWNYDIEDNTIATITSEEYIPDQQADEIVGAGGTKIYTIQGLKEGTTSIEFKYQRPWESKQPIQTKKFIVEVIE